MVIGKEAGNPIFPDPLFAMAMQSAGKYVENWGGATRWLMLFL
jgi:hypothetical protein